MTVWNPRRNLFRVWKGASESPQNGWQFDRDIANNFLYTDAIGANWNSDGIASFTDNARTYTDEYGTVIPFTFLVADTSTGEHVKERVNHWGNNNRIPFPLMVSCYVQAGNVPYLHMTPANVSSGPIFDASVPEWSRTTGGSTTRNHGFINKGNGIFRVWWTLVDSDLNTADPDFGFGPAQSGTVGSYTGAGESIYVGGIMMERWYEGQTEPSRYVPNHTNDRTPPAVRRRIEGVNPAVTVTNSIENSHELEDWAQQVNCVPVDGQETAVGRIQLAELTDDATLGYHYVGLSNQYTADTTRRRLSIYLKQGTARYVVFTDRAPSAGNVQWSNVFDLETGTWTFQGNLYVQDKYEAVKQPDDSWRISFVSGVNSAAYDNFIVGIANGPDKEDQEYAGTGDTLYAGGAQVEYGVDASPGPLVRTSGASASATFGGPQHAAWKGAIEPTLIPRLYGLPSTENTRPAAARIALSQVGRTTLQGRNARQTTDPIPGRDVIRVSEANSSQTVKVRT